MLLGMLLLALVLLYRVSNSFQIYRHLEGSYSIGKYSWRALYHLSNASGLRSSPSPVNFFSDGILILSLGVEATSGSACGLLGPPCSDILSESLLLSELLGSFPRAAAQALDVDPCGGECGHLPGATVDALASSLADSDSIC